MNIKILLLSSLFLLACLPSKADTPESLEVNRRQTGRFYIQPSLGLGINNFSGHFIDGFVEGLRDTEYTFIDGEPIILIRNPQRKRADFELHSRLGFTGGMHQSCRLGQLTLFEPYNTPFELLNTETIYIGGLPLD